MTSPEPERAPTGTRLHKIPAAADLIGFGETYTRRLISTGQLRAVVVNGVLRVPDDAIAEFIAHLPPADPQEA